MKLNRVLNNSNMQTEQNEQLNFDIKKKQQQQQRLFPWKTASQVDEFLFK